MSDSGDALAKAWDFFYLGIAGTPDHVWNTVEAPLAVHGQLCCEQPMYNATFPISADPLDVEYDGVALRLLLVADEERRREIHGRYLTPAQREAVSAHWSAQLKLKQAAAREAERQRVVVDHE